MTELSVLYGCEIRCKPILTGEFVETSNSRVSHMPNDRLYDYAKQATNSQQFLVITFIVSVCYAQSEKKL